MSTYPTSASSSSSSSLSPNEEEKKNHDGPLVIGRVIGEVVDSFRSTVKMRVVYNSNIAVYNAHKLFPSTLTHKPRIQLLQGSDFTSFFTVIMTDPDVPGPSDPYLREHLHWMIRDIPGSTDSSFGKEVVSYEKPQPKIGIHRIIFVLFKQKKKKRLCGPMRAPDSRDGFCTRKFAEENELGFPVAAVFFNCQSETAVRRRA